MDGLSGAHPRQPDIPAQERHRHPRCRIWHVVGAGQTAARMAIRHCGLQRLSGAKPDNAVPGSDLAFVERLMSEEGLFYYFEHEGDVHSPNLGRHQMVIADHNGTFPANAEPLVRYNRPGAVMKEDSIDRWRRELRSLQTNAIELRSWDYRSRSSRPVFSNGMQTTGAELMSRNVAGQYVYPHRASCQQLADHQLPLLSTIRQIFLETYLAILEGLRTNLR